MLFGLGSCNDTWWGRVGWSSRPVWCDWCWQEWCH